jgi:hypothetical protein
VRDEIWKNSYTGVEELLKKDKSCVNIHPNGLSTLTIHQGILLETIWNVSGKPTFTLLHCAAMNVYFHVREEASLSNAIAIFRLLLKFGADPIAAAKGVKIVHRGTGISNPLTGLTPSQTLNTVEGLGAIDDFKRTVHVEYDRFKAFLRKQEHYWKQRHNSMVPISPRLKECLMKLRHSKDCDYMTFQCKDNVDVTAHPNILSVNSPYFARFFAGPWAEQYPDRYWKTQYTSNVMTALLDFTYTGQVGIELREDCCMMYVAAAEFEFEDLKNVAQHYVVLTLSLENIEERLELGYLYENRTLIQDCRSYMTAHLSRQRQRSIRICRLTW